MATYTQNYRRQLQRAMPAEPPRGVRCGNPDCYTEDRRHRDAAAVARCHQFAAEVRATLEHAAHDAHYRKVYQGTGYAPGNADQ